jgi:hypothetical protein
MSALLILGLLVFLAILGALAGADTRHCPTAQGPGDINDRYWWPNG